MEMKHVMLDTDNMTYKEVDDLIKELREIRTRKLELHERYNHLHSMVSNMKDEDMVWVSKYTGEILNPDDWALYDNRNQCVYSEEAE
jgi:beta-galactosidase beta subunit